MRHPRTPVTRGSGAFPRLRPWSSRLLVALALPPGAAAASGGQVSLIEDDPQLLAVRRGLAGRALDDVRALGADGVRAGLGAA